MTNSFLITNIEIGQSSYKETINLGNGLKFLYSLNTKNYHYNEKEKSGVFIFGYLLPRLSKNEKEFDLRNLLNQLNFSNSNLFEEIKGIFTLIHIQNSQLHIYNDHLGMSKYFFTNDISEIILTDSLYALLEIKAKSVLDNNSLSEYYIFNYLLNGRTFYKDVFYSVPSSKLSVINNKFIYEKYFDIIDYISKGRNNLLKEETFTSISKTFVKIVEQYAKSSETKLSLSLTAGLDSRIILGSLIESGTIDFDSFTFGKAESYDVKYAKIIAEKSGIIHKHLYPGNNFFDNFENIADKTFRLGETLVSIYRSHRLDAYLNLGKESKSIIMGLAGSDLVRGIGFDRLIVSPIAYHCWNNKSFESFFINSHIKEKCRNIIEIDYSFFLDNKSNYSFLSNPMQYLFSVVVPLHFSQDIMLNQKIGIHTFVPFLDLDYLNLLKETDYIDLKNYMNYKLYNVKHRMRGLLFSAKLSDSLNKELSEYSLGKGYSPKDVITNLPSVYMKNWMFKMKNKSMFKIVNFDYGEWYWNYLVEYIQNERFEFLKNEIELLRRLKELPKYGSELHFLDYTKAINIQKAVELAQ